MTVMRSASPSPISRSKHSGFSTSRVNLLRAGPAPNMCRGRVPKHESDIPATESALPNFVRIFDDPRAFYEKVESLIVDSHDGANRIQDPHWCKGGQS